MRIASPTKLSPKISFFSLRQRGFVLLVVDFLVVDFLVVDFLVVDFFVTDFFVLRFFPRISSDIILTRLI